MNGLDASEEAKPGERSEDEDSTDGGRGLGSTRHNGSGMHEPVTAMPCRCCKWSFP